jgi:hypothetical protein
LWLLVLAVPRRLGRLICVSPHAQDPYVFRTFCFQGHQMAGAGVKQETESANLPRSRRKAQVQKQDLSQAQPSSVAGTRQRIAAGVMAEIVKVEEPDEDVLIAIAEKEPGAELPRSSRKLKVEKEDLSRSVSGKRQRIAAAVKAEIVKVENVKEPDEDVLIWDGDQRKTGAKRKAEKEPGAAAQHKKLKSQAKVTDHFPKVIDVDKDGSNEKKRLAKSKGLKVQAKVTKFLRKDKDDSDEKKKSAKKVKEDPPGTRCFTCLWSADECKEFSGVGPEGPRGVHITGGNAKRSSHTKLQAGDVYFPVKLSKCQLFVLGRLRVEAMVKPRAADYDRWHAARNLPTTKGCYSAQVLIETHPEAWAGTHGRVVPRIKDLRWLKPNGEQRAIKDPDNPRYVLAALQGVYRLASESAKMLTELLHRE